MIEDVTLLNVDDIQYLNITPLDDLPGLYQSKYRFAISDKNYTQYNDETLTTIAKKFEDFHANFVLFLKYNTELLTSAQEIKLKTFKNKYKEDYLRIVKDAVRQIEMFLDISLTVYTDKPQIVLYYDFESEMRFTENQISSYKATVSQIRHAPFQTSIWTPPPKHLFERNFENYRKVFSYV